MNRDLRQAIQDMSFRKKGSSYEGRVTYLKKQKSFTGASKADCKRRAMEYYNNLEYVKETKPADLTVSEYMKEWLEKKRLTIQPSTSYSYNKIFNCQIEKTLGHIDMTALDTKTIQLLINAHAEGSGNKKPLAKSGLKRLKNLLHVALEDAIKDGIIEKNPASRVVIPADHAISVKTKKQFSLSDEEIIKFREAALVKNKAGQIKYRDGIILVIMVATGMRIGEILALKWDDIDFENERIHIHSTVQKVANSGAKYRIKDGTKTNEGRFLPMSNSAKEYLILLKDYYREKGIVSDFVCCTEVGTMQTERNLSRSLDLLLERAELPKAISPHTLRHTFGSTMLRKGVGIEVVSKLMGHSSIELTLRIYTHVLEEQKIKAIKAVDII